MHSFHWEGMAWNEDPSASSAQERTQVSILYNGGYDGNVTVSVPTRVAQPQQRHFSEGGEDHHIAQINVPFEALKAFFFKYMNDQAMELLESANYLQMTYFALGQASVGQTDSEQGQWT